MRLNGPSEHTKLTPNSQSRGFLLTRKKDPMKALEEVETWRDEVLEARQKNIMGKTEIMP